MYTCTTRQPAQTAPGAFLWRNNIHGRTHPWHAAWRLSRLQCLLQPTRNRGTQASAQASRCPSAVNQEHPGCCTEYTFHMLLSCTLRLLLHILGTHAGAVPAAATNVADLQDSSHSTTPHLPQVWHVGPIHMLWSML
jgi:hypothetical protein